MSGEITGTAVEKYIYDILPARDAVLAEMERQAATEDIPIIGPAVGRLMYLLAQISGAQRIFEMGSAIGYSTIWLARAAGAKAEIYYTDGDPRNAQRAKTFFTQAKVEKRIRMMTGDALELLDRVRGKFDMVFIDVNKDQYPAALKKALPRIQRGGLLVTDNTLWSGRVTQAADSEATRGIQEFNKAVYAAKELFPVMIPLRDGVTVCRKL
ncbi:MAG TPA: O-methyltransferase [Candidatus Acidoferrales bacterium]|nr:O-methyltransferase [Candidatus Acidoferrales bacterium]